MAYVTLDGIRYELPKQDDLTPNEVIMAYDMGAKIPENGDGGLDPHWIVPMIVIAMKRAGEAVNPAVIAELGDIPLSQMKWEEDPPPNRAAKRAAAAGNGGPSKARARSGNPSTPKSSGSTPG